MPGNKQELARLLIQSGADLNAADKLGYTALHFAAGYADPASAQLLAESGADVNAENVQGLTPTDIASVLGKEEIAGVLKAHGGEARKYHSKNETKAKYERGRFIGKSGIVPMKKSFETDVGFSVFSLKIDQFGAGGAGYYEGFYTIFGYIFKEPAHTYVVDVAGEVNQQKVYAVARDKETGQVVGIFR